MGYDVNILIINLTLIHVEVCFSSICLLLINKCFFFVSGKLSNSTLIDVTHKTVLQIGKCTYLQNECTYSHVTYDL